MKKLLIIALALLTLAALLAGCGKTSAGTPATTVTATVTTTVTTTVPAATSNAARLPVYSWEEAVDHIGEMAIVVGPVVNYFDPKEVFGDIKLGIGKIYSQPGWMDVEIKLERGTFSSDDYVGKTVAITGEIYLLDLFGKPAAAIDVTDLSQIEVLK